MVHRATTGNAAAFDVLSEFDAVLDFPRDAEAAAVFGTQIGIEDTVALEEVCGRVRAVLDGGI